MASQQRDPVTVEALQKIAKARGFSLSREAELDYVALVEDNQAALDFVLGLPEYADPRLAPVVGVDERKYSRPDSSENPLNAWSHRTDIKASKSGVESGILAGKTIAIKDNVRMAGIPLVDGTEPYHLSKDKPYPIPDLDAPVVSRVLEAGAAILGTSTCENYCFSAMSYTSATGPVENPYLKGYTAGGSSSGSAVLLAVERIKKWRQAQGFPPADLGEGVDLAIGADQGGSIRLPAAYCGVYGLKPTLGLVPYTGIEGIHPFCDHVGPMATSIRDTALLLSAISGYDGFDPRMTPESPLRANVPQYHTLLDQEITSRTTAGTWTATSAAKGLRIGVLKEAFEVPGLESQVASAVRAAASRFETLGAVVGEVSVPLHAYGAQIFAAMRVHVADTLFNPAPTTLSYPFLTDSAPQDQQWFDNLNKSNPQVIFSLLGGLYLQDRKRVPEEVRRKVLSQVHALRAAYDHALEEYDVLITPVNPRAGERHGSAEMSVREKSNHVLSNTANTCPFNVSGHPALVIPAGWGLVEGVEQKLPIGIQIVGKRWDEEKVLLAAAAWEVGGKGLDTE